MIEMGYDIVEKYIRVNIPTVIINNIQNHLFSLGVNITIIF